MSTARLVAVKDRLQAILGGRATTYFRLISGVLHGTTSREELEQQARAPVPRACLPWALTASLYPRVPPCACLQAPAFVGDANMPLHRALVHGCMLHAQAQQAQQNARLFAAGAEAPAPHAAARPGAPAAAWHHAAGAPQQHQPRAPSPAPLAAQQQAWQAQHAAAAAHAQQAAAAAAAHASYGRRADGRHAALSPAEPSPRVGAPRVPSDSPPLKRGIEAVDTAASAPAQAKRHAPGPAASGPSVAATVLGAPLLPGHWREDLPDTLAAGLRLQAAAETAGVPRVERAAARLAAAAVGAHIRAVLQHAARLAAGVAPGAPAPREGLTVEALLAASLATDSPLRGERHRAVERLRVLVATQPPPEARAAALAAQRASLPLPCVKAEEAHHCVKLEAPSEAEGADPMEETAEAPTPEELPPGFVADNTKCR